MSLPDDSLFAPFCQALTLLGENSESILWLSDCQFRRFIYISPAFERIWGIPCAEAYQHPQVWCDAIVQDELANVALAKFHAVQQGEYCAQNKSYRIKRADGEIRLLIDQSFPLFDQQQVCYGFCGITSDVTDTQLVTAMQHAKEQAEAANRLKTEFLGNMSHDIKAPLHAILGMAEILNIRRYFPEQKQYIDGIVESGSLISKLVDELINFATLEAGKLQVSNEIFDLHQLIESIIKSLANRAFNKNLRLILSYSESTPHIICSDPRIIRRIVLNLLSNAIKFTDKGYILISVEAHNQDDNQAKLHITLKDTGHGIPPDQLQNIFERFYQVEQENKQQRYGSGLGLAIAKQMAQQLGGDLTVTSRVAKGSIFCLSLNASVHNHQEMQQATLHDINAFTILVINDNPSQGEALCRQLHPHIAHLATTENAMVMITNAQQKQTTYHLIIIDDELLHSDFITFATAVMTTTTDDNTLLIALTNTIDGYTKAQLANVNIPYSIDKHLANDTIAEQILKYLEQYCQSNQLQQPEEPNNLRVLLIEDDQFSQKVALAMLENLACQVDVADLAKTAIDKVNQNDYDLIFLDLNLPDSSGLKLLQAVRELCDTPLCVLTAYTLEDEAHFVHEQGADYFLAKPAGLDDFKHIISQIQQEKHIK